MGWFERIALIAAICLTVTGCGHLPWFGHSGLGGSHPLEPAHPNPVVIPIGDRELLWNQLVDTLDNYFRIAHEERLRVIGGTVTAGRIDTHPEVGSSLFEPWRHDSTPGFEKLHSTLQSIRRRAVVHVVPTTQGYSVEVVVLKELEDLDHPEQSSVTGVSLRHDGTLERLERDPLADPTTFGWIPMGRDVSLEQRIVGELQDRLNGA